MTLQPRRAVAVVAAATALASISAVGFIVIQLSAANTAVTAAVDPTVEPSLSNGMRPTSAPLGGEGEPPLGDIVKVHDSTHVTLPLDPYLTPMSDIRLIDQARDIASAACMRSLGFTHWTANTIRTWSPGDYRESDIFEYLDPKAAADSGYPRLPAETMPRGFTESKHEPTREERKAFDGAAAQTETGRAIPAKGCAGQADEKLYGTVRKLPADPRGLAVASRSRAIRDSRVQAALAAWRACMQDVGLTSYDHPVTAQGDPRWESRAEGTPASAEERRVAAADANCQAELNLVGTYKAVRAAYEHRLLDGNKEKIAESRQIFAGWVSNAKQIIKAG
ncbi:hypothetical protein [Acrocarpospora sp. B8E8]|uniref:hypothetical protein n=1 Tax=Acrocarpospora sp. B8E8 TaxID=3153572 RepID=UPI00325DD27F